MPSEILDVLFESVKVEQDKHNLSPSGRFHIPEDGTYDEYLTFIRSMPEQNPEIFGMHDNVNITKELQETKQVPKPSVERIFGDSFSFRYKKINFRYLIQFY